MNHTSLVHLVTVGLNSFSLPEVQLGSTVTGRESNGSQHNQIQTVPHMLLKIFPFV
uniref:Uncharacterized protein n=1 Tax=Anguilla anguilla TaxID=7936 RepID=A0A0E9S4H5_ANGAN